MRTKILFVSGCALLSTGCPSVSTFGLARTLNQGAVQGWVAPGGGASLVSETVSNGMGGTQTATATAAYPVLQGGVRYGITDHVELGAQIGFSGVSIDGKFALLRSETMDKGVNISVDPTVGFIGYGASTSGTGGSSAFVGVLTANLPFLFGFDFGGHELIIGPRAIDQVLFGNVTSGSTSGSSTEDILYVGGSLGFAIRASAAVRILPEFSFGVPVWESFTSTSSNNGFGGVVLQGGIAIVFGTSNQYEAPEPPPPPPQMQPPPPVAPPPPPATPPPPPPVQ